MAYFDEFHWNLEQIYEKKNVYFKEYKKDHILTIVYMENSLKHENYKQRPWKGFYLGVKTIRSSLSMSIKCSI